MYDVHIHDTYLHIHMYICTLHSWSAAGYRIIPLIASLDRKASPQASQIRKSKIICVLRASANQKIRKSTSQQNQQIKDYSFAPRISKSENQQIRKATNQQIKDYLFALTNKVANTPVSPVNLSQ